MEEVLAQARRERHGKIIDVVEGVPNEGYDVGVRGSRKEWDKFCTHNRTATTRCPRLSHA
jgi:hypothetical protein